MNQGTSSGEAGPRSLVSDRVYGAIGAAAVLLALFFLLRGGPSDDGTAGPAAAPPQLTIVEPAAGAEVASPVTVTFDSGEALEADGSARGGTLHVHLKAGPLELMSSPGTLRPAGATRYRWTLALEPGEHTLRMYWSGADHQPLGGGASAPVTVRVR